MIVYKLSPELGDGQQCEYVSDEDALIARVREWVYNIGRHCHGEAFSVKTVEMCEEKFNSLPEL